MGRWVATLLAVGLALIALARFGTQPERDAWTVLGATADGSFLHLRFAVGNTGVFANQLVTRGAMLRDRKSALEHRAIGGPAVFDDGGVHGAHDRLDHASGSWEWEVTGSALRSTGRIDGASRECPPAVGTLTGVIDLPSFAESDSDGALLRGVGIALRTHAVGNVRGASLYALSPHGGLVVDPLADCAAWVRVGESVWAGAAAPVPESRAQAFELSLGPHRVHVQPGSRFVIQRTQDATLLGERWLSWLAGFPEPTLELRRARVTVMGQPNAWTGLLVFRDQN